jgi:hypothetical protein
MDGRGTGLAIPLEHGRRLVLTEPGSSSATCCEARPPAAVSLRRPPRITFDGLRFARLTASTRGSARPGNRSPRLRWSTTGCRRRRSVQSDLIAVRPRLRTVAVDVVVDSEVVVLVGEVAERTERARASARVALRPDAQGLSRTVVALTVAGALAVAGTARTAAADGDDHELLHQGLLLCRCFSSFVARRRT